MSQLKPIWQVLNAQIPTTYAELEQIFLQNRHLTAPDAQADFFAARAPFSYELAEVGLSAPAFAPALQRLQQARAQKQKVLIFGDYDVDGNCATAIMWQALQAFGITAVPFIPHRQKHGYGLTARSLAAILGEPDLDPNYHPDQSADSAQSPPAPSAPSSTTPPHLIITVDNGIVAHDALQQLAARGIDVILTDHHQLETDPDSGQPLLPVATAIFHSTQLCGAGVAWFFARELLRAAHPDPAEFATFLDQWLDLVCLATLVDQVPVLGANRSFIIHGLAQLRRNRRLGLQKLCQSARLDPAEITAQSIDYVLGPRINAIGRLKNNLDALRLLCTTSPTRATQLAANLESTNQARRDLTDHLLDLALTQAATQTDHHLIIVVSPEFHEGIIGLIASRLVEKFHKPVLVIATTGAVAKGSARSIPGVNITEILRAARQHLLEVGGHPLAAGCSLALDQLGPATAALWDIAQATITADQLIPHYDIECQVPAPLLGPDFLPLLAKFQPFGHHNPEFQLAVPQLQLITVEAIGKESQHRKFLWRQADSGAQFTTLLWNAVRRFDQLPAPGDTIYQLLVVPSLNTWRGRQSLQLQLLDFQPV